MKPIIEQLQKYHLIRALSFSSGASMGDETVWGIAVLIFRLAMENHNARHLP